MKRTLTALAIAGLGMTSLQGCAGQPDQNAQFDNDTPTGRQGHSAQMNDTLNERQQSTHRSGQFDNATPTEREPRSAQMQNTMDDSGQGSHQQWSNDTNHTAPSQGGSAGNMQYDNGTPDSRQGHSGQMQSTLPDGDNRADDNAR
ncbi:hypothetical protein [Kushneria phosphatilytica]|uniref:Lipoprotein n=1 Tax=Kushneria phosphatilytica TaxID=657387 RepID=A0A5C1A126_9GAMM|nr:hypothetical protein [Kushneria phosphatilytica]QEL11764.1 hypothetical protein FY550_11865 [Kushneria phosphatilytica]